MIDTTLVVELVVVCVYVVGAVMWRFVWVIGMGVIDTTFVVELVVVCGVYVVGAVVGGEMILMVDVFPLV